MAPTIITIAEIKNNTKDVYVVYALVSILGEISTA